MLCANIHVELVGRRPGIFLIPSIVTLCFTAVSPGTVIELNRLAGEPIDVLVNGKYVAKGEVVVIEETFGIRVTEIIK